MDGKAGKIEYGTFEINKAAYWFVVALPAYHYFSCQRKGAVKKGMKYRSSVNLCIQLEIVMADDLRVWFYFNGRKIRMGASDMYAVRKPACTADGKCI